MDYKWLKADGTSPYRACRWPIGKWVEAAGPLVLCGKGIHACHESQIVHHISECLWEFEGEGDTLEADDKFCCRRRRPHRRHGHARTSGPSRSGGQRP